MADDFSAGWQRASLYYAVQAAWGTAEDSTGDPFKQIRETSKSLPYIVPPVIPPADAMGSGQPMRQLGYYTLGRDGGAFSTTHPLTALALRDLGLLFYQGHYYTSTDHYMSPLNAANAVIWTPETTEWATVVVKTDAGAGPQSAFAAQSALISGLTITIPQSTPGDTSGACEISANWIVEKSPRAAGFTLGTVASDTGAYIHTKDWILELDGLARDFVSATINLTNGAALLPNAAELAAGATVGMLGVTVSLTCLLNQEADAAGAENGSTCDVLLDDLEGMTASTFEFIYALGAVAEYIIIKATLIPTGPPTLSEVNGIQALTFNLQEASSATAITSPQIIFDSTSAFTSSPFYNA